MHSDYEIVASNTLQVGDWVKVADDGVSLVLAHIASEDSYILATITPDGDFVSNFWGVYRMAYVAKLRSPEFYLGSCGPVANDYADWQFPLGLTPSGPVLRVKANAPEGHRATIYHNLASNTGSTSKPAHYSPIDSFKLWASERARIIGATPIISYVKP